MPMILRCRVRAVDALNMRNQNLLDLDLPQCLVSGLEQQSHEGLPRPEAGVARLRQAGVAAIGGNWGLTRFLIDLPTEITERSLDAARSDMNISKLCATTVREISKGLETAAKRLEINSQ